MKIVEVSVQNEGTQYVATIVLLDEGVRVTGTGLRKLPEEALNTAFSDAAGKIVAPLRDSMRVSLSVQF